MMMNIISSLKHSMRNIILKITDIFRIILEYCEEKIMMFLVNIAFYLIFSLYFKRNIKSYLTTEDYNKINPLFKTGVKHLNSVIMDKLTSNFFSLEEIEYYNNIIKNLSEYERGLVLRSLQLLYDDIEWFSNTYVPKKYDGYDEQVYLKYKIFFKIKYFKINERNENNITLSNNKTIKLFPFNWIFYRPISQIKRRKDIIKNL